MSRLNQSAASGAVPAPASPGRETAAPATFSPDVEPVDAALDFWSGARVSLRVLAVFAAVAGLWFGEALFLPIVLAVLLTLLLTPAVDLSDRLGLPRWLGALIVVLVLLAALVGVTAKLVEPAQTWLNPKSSEWRKLEQRVRDIKRPFEQIQGAQDRVASIAEGAGPQQPKQIVVEKRDVLGSLRGAQPIFVGALSTIVLLFFLLASGDMFLRKLIRVLPRLHDKKTAVGIARTVQVEIGRYFLTIAMINLGLGTLTAIAMALLGMPSPLFWGALAGLLNFIPYAGPGTALVLLTAGAFVSMDSWSSVL
ncbi:MAG: AI-2E family transporter, partial [Gammaproteobacteria bacterium]